MACAKEELYQTSEEQAFIHAVPLLSQGKAFSRRVCFCRQPLLGGGPSQQQSQALVVPQQDTYLNSRAEALHNVESTISELGGIFQQLAHMVSNLHQFWLCMHVTGPHVASQKGAELDGLD